MIKNWLLCILAGITIQLSAQCRELFFTEYLSGSGGNRALEIYNPSDSSINLNQYRITCWVNGTSSWSAGLSDTLSGIMPPNSAWVILPDLRDSAGNISPNLMDSALQAKASVWAGKGNNPMDFDGDDAISLDKLNGEVFLPVDIIGKIGERPENLGQTGGYTGWSDSFPFHTGIGEVFTKNAGMRRKHGVNRGINLNPAFFDPTKEWLLANAGIYDSLGTHLGSCNKFPAAAKSFDRGEIRIYPNPAFSNIRIASPLMPQQIQLYTASGNQINTNIAESDGTFISLDVSGLIPGCYLLRITMTGGISDHAFIKL